MEGESGVYRSVIHEFHSWDIQRDQMEREIGVTRCIMDEIHSLDIKRDQMGMISQGRSSSMILRGTPLSPSI